MQLRGSYCDVQLPNAPAVRLELGSLWCRRRRCRDDFLCHLPGDLGQPSGSEGAQFGQHRLEAGRDGFEVSVNDGGLVFHALLASEFNRISEDEMRAQLEKLLDGQCVGVRYDGTLEILCRRNDLYTATSVLESVLFALKKAQETIQSGEPE